MNKYASIYYVDEPKEGEVVKRVDFNNGEDYLKWRKEEDNFKFVIHVHWYEK